VVRYPAEHLDRQIMTVITLMRISDNKEELERHFVKSAPTIQQQPAASSGDWCRPGAGSV